MAYMKCPTCEGQCEYKIGKGYVCKCCGNLYRSEEISDEIIEKLNYANLLRREEYNFERALSLCEEILKKTPNHQEANWCALLAEYQIVYLKNAQGEYKPTLLNPNVAKPINKCQYYEKLNMDYRKMADIAEKVRLEIVRESAQIPDYDVFISYKQHVNQSDTILTEEAAWAEELYKRLSKKNLHVFYDEVSLKNGTAGWEPHIYSALKSAKYMILLGSSIENINSTWVKNEWKRFISYRKIGSDKTFSVVGKNFKPEQLDYDLQSQQMLSADKAEWLDVLVKNVDDYFTKYKVDFLLAEAETFISKRKFKKAKNNYLKVCRADQRNSKAYWGLLKCKLKAMDDYDIVKGKKIGKILEYKEALRYSSGKEKEYYTKVASDNLIHNTHGYDRKNYMEWKRKTKVKRFFKKFFLLLFLLFFSSSCVLGGLYYKDRREKECRFTLNYGEASGKISSVKTYSDSDIPDFPSGLKIAGKQYMDFVGWFTEPNCGGIKVADEFGKSDLSMDVLLVLCDDAHTIPLYAGFQVHEYDVTFYDNDGRTILKTMGIAYGTCIDDVDTNIYVGEKKVIAWSDSWNGSEYHGNIEKDMSLYASGFAIKVEYNTSGGQEIESTLVRVGDRIPLPIPERQYYEFVGWEYQNNLIEYGFLAPEENVTLVAQWKRTHFSMTLDTNDGLGESSEMVKAGTTVSLPVLTRPYYRFAGWTYNGNLIDNSFVMPEKDVLLIACWERTHYFVSFDYGGSSHTEYVPIGESIMFPSASKEGYSFEGWTNNGKVYNNAFVPTGDMSFYASWKAKQYVVTLDANGGTVSSPSQTVTFDSLYQLPVPTKQGYIFVGWYTSLDKYGERKTDKNGQSLTKWDDTRDITLHAMWSMDYTVPFLRQNCKDNNGYNPAEKGTTSGAINDVLSHESFELLQLNCSGCVKNSDGTYFIPQGEEVKLSTKILQDPSKLPTPGNYLSWTRHYIFKDTYKEKIFETNINGQTIEYGAYYIKVSYSDGTVSESNKVNFMDGAKKGSVIDLVFTASKTKKIRKIEVVFLYETYYNCTPFWSAAVWATPNWRCSATIDFDY